MKSILLVEKLPGQTPLQCIKDVRTRFPNLAKEKISVAGRLDPMAEGLLLLLIGEENKKRQGYEKLKKEYLFSVVFGITTDSYDGMGIIGKIEQSPPLSELEEKLRKTFPSYIGKIKQSYPPFSSKPINGKPLYYWSRKQKLKPSELPTKEVTIFSLELLPLEKISLSVLADNIIQRIKTIEGKFRQEEIIKQWKALKKQYKNTPLLLATFSVTCSSGTYVRSIVNDLGEKLECGAIAYTIKRTRIGKFTLNHKSLL